MSAQTEITGGVWTHPEKPLQKLTRNSSGAFNEPNYGLWDYLTDEKMRFYGWVFTPATPQPTGTETRVCSDIAAPQALNVESQIEQLKDLIGELVDFSCPPSNARCLERFDAALKKAAEVLKG